MKEQNIFEKRKKSAEKKMAEGNSILKESEKVAIQNKWFFTMVLDVEMIDKIVNEAEKYGMKPGKFAEMILFMKLKESEKEKA